MKEKHKIYTHWISNSYQKIFRVLKAKNVFNEDAFHDAMLLVYDELQKLDSCTVNECERLFKENYYQLLSRANSRSFKYAYFEDSLFDIVVSQSVNDTEGYTTKDNKGLASRITTYVQANFTKDDISLFMMRVNHPNLSFDSLSKYLGVSPSTVHRKMQRIKDGIINSIDYEYKF